MFFFSFIFNDYMCLIGFDLKQNIQNTRKIYESLLRHTDNDFPLGMCDSKIGVSRIRINFS